MRGNPFAVILIAFLGLAGCTQIMAEKIVAPPNHWQPHPPENSAADGRAVTIPVGPPGAVIAAWVLEPAHDSRGTILFLHGILADHQQLRKTAHAMRDAGYTAVMVDLRGHGRSTGDHITYGVIESQDLILLTNWLQKNGLCGDTVGVYGFSYGAATAIEYAGVDPRVSTVVALASFATLADEAPHLGRTLFPIPGLFLSDRAYAKMLMEAGKVADFDPAAASPLASIRQTQAHILLLHGDLDMVIPVSNSMALRDAAPQTTELHVLRARGHLIAPLDFGGEVKDAARKWFDVYLVRGAVHNQTDLCLR